MNIKKIIGTFMAAAGLGMALAAPSMAQTTFASAAAADGSASNGFVYTTGSNGGFTTAPGAVFTSQLLSPVAFNFPSSLTFVGLNNVGIVSGLGTILTPYSQQLTGGSFKLTTVISSVTTTLLEGTFGGGNVLTANNNSNTASVQNTFTNVMYTGGTYFLASGLSNPGSFVIGLTTTAPVTKTGDYITSFQAGGTANFSATNTTVPEPASVIPFALGGLGLLGLIARKTRRTSGAAA